jgi:hypothetical protein
MEWIDIVGWTGSALLVWSLAQARVLRFRVLNLVASLVLTGYNAVLEVWPMAVVNGVLVAINCWQIARLLRTRHDSAAYEVVEVGADDDFLRHVLARERAEIERWNPGFRWDGAGSGRHAFIVVHEAEVVGVVLVADSGPGTARIELDYVRPRFRDFTPGEFVYRSSRLFADRGYSRVLAPERMVDQSYLERVGFRRTEAGLALEVPAAA